MDQDGQPPPPPPHMPKRAQGSRRRTRSTGSLPYSWSVKSGESSSSVGEWELCRDIGMSSLHQSDSDEVSGKGHLYNLQRPHRLSCLFPSIESDSVNENFSPVRPTTRRSRGLFKVLRRKRKLKRMAIEMSSASTSRPSSSTTSGKKKRILRHVSNGENRLYYGGGLYVGKRKRSTRSITEPPQRTVLALHKLSLRDDQHPHSSSSLSSSDSDTGIYTNDEGREGDDEQSDWVGEASGGAAPRSVWDDSDRGEGMEDSQLFSLPLSGRFGREIRGGRRRVRSDRASFSVLTSANEKLSRFLQDPTRTQLRLMDRMSTNSATCSVSCGVHVQSKIYVQTYGLHPMKESERFQLAHLAELYSLDMQVTEQVPGLRCPILTKTSNTVRGEPVSITTLSFGEIKRRRRIAPNQTSNILTDVEMCESSGEMIVKTYADDDATMSDSFSSLRQLGHKSS